MFNSRELLLTSRNVLGVDFSHGKGGPPVTKSINLAGEGGGLVVVSAGSRGSGVGGEKEEEEEEKEEEEKEEEEEEEA